MSSSQSSYHGPRSGLGLGISTEDTESFPGKAYGLIKLDQPELPASNWEEPWSAYSAQLDSWSHEDVPMTSSRTQRLQNNTRQAINKHKRQRPESHNSHGTDYPTAKVPCRCNITKFSRRESGDPEISRRAKPTGGHATSTSSPARATTDLSNTATLPTVDHVAYHRSRRLANSHPKTTSGFTSIVSSSKGIIVNYESLSPVDHPNQYGPDSENCDDEITDNTHMFAIHSTSRRVPHTQVEKKYREGLKAMFDRLRLILPAANEDPQQHITPESILKEAHPGLTQQPRGLTKAGLIALAIEHIKHIETDKGHIQDCCDGILEENLRLLGRVAELENLLRICYIPFF